MTATAPSPSSETSNVVWTTGSRLKSSAIKLLSDLRQTASLTASAISSETDPKRLSELSSLLAECQSTLDSCRIEQMLAKASPKQVKAFGAYAKAIEARVFNVVALMGGNQCLAEGTLVATPAGPVPIERIRPGDTVYSHTGSPIRVLKTFDNGIRECVELTNRGSSLVVCTRDHKLLSKTANKNNPAVRPVSEFTERHTVVRRVEVDPPLGDVDEPHAYALGALLGDGCCRQKGNRVCISSGVDEVPAKVAGILGSGHRRLHAKNYTYAVGTARPRHYDEWCHGRYAHEKTVDLERIRTWNRRSLLAFVAGILDTDGSVFVDSFGALVIQVTMQALPVVEAIKYAFLALWQTEVRILKSDREKYVNGPIYEIKVANNAYSKRILKELDPHLVHPTKKWDPEYEKGVARRTNAEWVGVRIRDHGWVHTYDLMVDSPEHLFLLANGLVVSNSGKSFCGAAMTAKAIRDDLPPNSIVWSVSPNAELSIKTPQRYLWEFLPHGKIDTPYNPKTGFGVHNPLFIYDRRDKDNPNGRNIVVYFKTQAQYENDPDSFESATVTGIVWVDESIDEKCWNAIQPRIAIHNVPVIVTTIPRMDWMFEAFEEPPPEARVYFDKLLPMDNPAMSADAYARLEMSIASEEERDMRLFGKFMSFGGIVYREFRKEYKPDGHLCRPFPIPDDWPKWRTMDVGMDHPTVCLWCTVAPNGNRYVYREYRSRHTPIVKDAETILAMSGNEHYHSGCLIDASAYYVTKASPKTVAQQYEQAGLKMTPAVRVGRSGVGEWPLIQAVKRNLLNNQLFIFDTCEGLIAEFRKWKFKRNIHGEPVGDDFEDKNNDGLDALKYWIAIGPTFGTPTLEYENTLND